MPCYAMAHGIVLTDQTNKRCLVVTRCECFKVVIQVFSFDQSSNVFSCLEETFRCSYGGCIRAEQECDGVKDCADGSDERTLNCPGILNQIRGNCR